MIHVYPSLRRGVQCKLQSKQFTITSLLNKAAARSIVIPSLEPRYQQTQGVQHTPTSTRAKIIRRVTLLNRQVSVRQCSSSASSALVKMASDRDVLSSK